MGLVRSTLVRSTLRRSDTSSSTPTPDPVDPTTVATWDLTLCRYFLIDNENGSDANLGYVDAAPGSVIVPTGLAKKTINGTTGLLSIVPRAGAGRVAVILMKNRAAGDNYLDTDGVTQSSMDLSGIAGYRSFYTRGSTDLTNSVSDRVRVGAVTKLAGPNVDGSFSAAAGATAAQLTVAGAVALPAEPVPDSGVDTSILGYRIRFTGNVTAGLADVCRVVYRNSAGVGGTIAFGQNTASAPALGDSFFIERPGVRVVQFIESDNAAAGPGLTTSSGQGATSSGTIGIGCTPAAAATQMLLGSASRAAYSFCEVVAPTLSAQAALIKQGAQEVNLRPAWTDEGGTARDVGMGLRTPSLEGISIRYLFIGSRGLFVTGTPNSTGPQTLIQTTGPVALLGGNYIANGGQIESPIPSTASVGVGNGGSTTIARLRVVGGSASPFAAAGLNWAGSVVIRGVEGEGNASAVIRLGQNILSAGGGNNARAVVAVLDDVVTGAAGGNTGVGIAVDTRFAKVEIGRTVACTVSGTVGEVRLGDGAALTTYAALNRTNVVDSKGNDVQGTAGPLVGQCKLVTNSSGGALAVGDVVRSNGTTAQVTSAQGDTVANATPFGIMVTPPASAAVGYMAVDGAPSVNFDIAPTAGAVAWLSTSAARTATATEPTISGTQQKVRLGRVIAFSGTAGQLPLEIDTQPVTLSRIVEASNVAMAFAVGTAETIVATGTITADRAFTLPALTTVSENQIFELKDATTAGAFNLNLTPTGTDAIDLVNAAVAIVAGSRRALRVKKAPTVGWVLM